MVERYFIEQARNLAGLVVNGGHLEEVQVSMNCLDLTSRDMTAANRRISNLEKKGPVDKTEELGNTYLKKYQEKINKKVKHEVDKLHSDRWGEDERKRQIRFHSFLHKRVLKGNYSDETIEKTRTLLEAARGYYDKGWEDMDDIHNAIVLTHKNINNFDNEMEVLGEVMYGHDDRVERFKKLCVESGVTTKEVTDIHNYLTNEIVDNNRRFASVARLNEINKKSEERAICSLIVERQK